MQKTAYEMRISDWSSDVCSSDLEKGVFANDQQSFSGGSVFQIVVDRIAEDCNILICDDLGDEWADFIGLSTDGSPNMVSFYHAKHGIRSLGASPFHEAVGQALKNLGRMPLAAEIGRAACRERGCPYV